MRSPGGVVFLFSIINSDKKMDRNNNHDYRVILSVIGLICLALLLSIDNTIPPPWQECYRSDCKINWEIWGKYQRWQQNGTRPTGVETPEEIAKFEHYLNRIKGG
jgi:hypothetical protein